ncbi:MAG: P1 family peptidase [Vulcanisaeta sp.]
MVSRKTVRIGIGGIKIGHYTETREPTGVTVILFEEPLMAAISQKGPAPGTRETDLLRLMHREDYRINALVFTGRSVFGLRTVDGVVDYLFERGIGFDVGFMKVPIVPSAVIFDFKPGQKVIPTWQWGYEAAKSAQDTFYIGDVGVGAGATVGKALGLENASQSGIGFSDIWINRIYIAALTVVNAFGDVVGPSGELIAGPRDPNSGKIIRTTEYMAKSNYVKVIRGTSTTLSLIITNIRVSRESLSRIAEYAHYGLASRIEPYNTDYDGDTVFAVTTGEVNYDINPILNYIKQVVSESVLSIFNRVGIKT